MKRFLTPILAMLCIGCFLLAPTQAQTIIGYQKVCNGKRCWMEPIYSQPQVVSVPVQTQQVYSTPVLSTPVTTPVYLDESPDAVLPSRPLVSLVSNRLATGEAAHTPMSEVVRVINLLPKPDVAFVDFGCGYDARWCVAAAERWKCKCVGIEMDPDRANAARERVRNLGLDNLITIVEGDATEVPVSGDVAVAYLYPSVLTKLTTRVKGYKAFASYIHQPPGLVSTKNGDTWLYTRQVQQFQQSYPTHSAVWGGVAYNQPLCNNPYCAMCNSIRQQLGQY